jgi:hypothetical protein
MQSLVGFTEQSADVPYPIQILSFDNAEVKHQDARSQRGRTNQRHAVSASQSTFQLSVIQLTSRREGPFDERVQESREEATEKRQLGILARQP